MSCDHDFHAKVRIHCFDDRPGQGSLDLEAKCAKCGVELRFPFPRGVLNDQATTNISRSEVIVPFYLSTHKFDPNAPCYTISGPELPESSERERH